MRPGYFTTGGARHEIADPRFTPAGVRKELFEGYFTVGGERRQWFGRGDLIVAKPVGSETDSPFYRMTVGDAGLTFTQLAYAGPEFSSDLRHQAVSAVPLGRSQFIVFRGPQSVGSRMRGVVCTVSGDTISGTEIVATNAGGVGPSSFGPKAAFVLDDQIYVMTADGEAWRVAVAASSMTLTALTVTGTVTLPGTSYGGGFNLGGNAYVVYDRNASVEDHFRIQSVTIVGDTISLGPAVGVSETASLEFAISDGKQVYFWRTTSSPNPVHVGTFTNGVWSFTTLGVVSLIEINVGVRLR